MSDSAQPCSRIRGATRSATWITNWNGWTRISVHKIAEEIMKITRGFAATRDRFADGYSLAGLERTSGREDLNLPTPRSRTEEESAQSRNKMPRSDDEHAHSMPIRPQVKAMRAG